MSITFVECTIISLAFFFFWYIDRKLVSSFSSLQILVNIFLHVLSSKYILSCEVAIKFEKMAGGEPGKKERKKNDNLVAFLTLKV